MGLGWNLSTIDIVRTNVRSEPLWEGSFWINYDNRFQLVMNGTSYDLQRGEGEGQMDGRYFADGAPDLYIERINDCSDDGNCFNDSGGSQVNKTTEYWIVKTPDGTMYRLGYNEESEQVLYPTLNGESGPLPASPYSGPVKNYSAYRWRVDQVSDVYGNEMVYEYDEYTTSGSGQRDVANYITNIKYNNQGGSWLSHIEFAGQNVGSTPDALDWPIFTTRRNLNRISVWWESTLVNEYIFNMAHEYLPNSGLKIILTGISPYGLGGEAGGHVLPGPSFGYTEYANKGWCLPAPGNGCYTEWDQEQFPYERLTSVDNGYGGRTEFEYAHEVDGRGDWWQGFWNYHVTEVRTFDGINDTSGPVQVRNYDYGSPCYNQWGDNWPTGGTNCASPGAPENGSLVGYDVVTVTVGTADQPFSISEHHFRTTGHYSLLGREELTRQFGPDGTSLFQEVSNTYGLNETGTNARCLNAGLPSSANFTCLKTTESTVYTPGTSDSVTTKTEYFYDPSYQGGVQYGRQTRVNYFHITNEGLEKLLRYTVQVFDANTTNWIITQRVSRRQDGTTHDLLARTFYLYDGSLDPDGQVITRGELTLTRSQLNLNNVSPSPFDSVIYELVDTSYTYDAYGNLTTTTQYEDYGQIGYEVGSTDWSYWTNPTTGNGRTTTTVYDANNLFPISVSNPLGHTIQTTYDASFAWLPASVTDVPNGITTQYRYDEFSRLRKVIRPGDSESDPTILYTYFDDADPDGQTGGFTFTSPLLIATGYSDSTNKESSRAFYDGFGRLVQQQEVRSDIAGQGLPRDVLTSFAYDALGRTVCQTVPYGTTAYSWDQSSPYQETPCTSRTHTATTYDVLGRVLTTEAPNGSSNTYVYRLDPETGYSRVNTIDANRHRIQHNYDPLGRLVITYELSGNCGNYWADEGFGCVAPYDEPWDVYGTTLYAYDMQDNLRTVTDDAGNETTMWYDFLRRKTSMSDPDMGDWSYEYDTVGNLVEQTNNKGQTIIFTYDDLNRLDTKLHNGQVLADFSYDNCASGIGRLCRVDDLSGWHTYSYDNRGRLVQESRTVDDSAPFVMSYGYDALDRVTAVIYPNGETVTTEYNPQGLPITLSGSDTYVSDVTYNARGQMVDLFRGNGVNTTHHYYGATGSSGNSNFRLSRIQTGSLLDLGYEYDPVGNITRITDNLLPANKWQQFEYDDLNRLTRAWTPVSAVDAYDHTYDYNPIGNILSYDGVTYQYNDPAHIHAVTDLSNGHNFDYDNNGNMTARNDLTGSYTQVWDVENRLVSVTQSGVGTTSFDYDVHGIRLKTTAPDGSVTYYPFPNYEVEYNTDMVDVDMIYVSSSSGGTLAAGFSSTIPFADEDILRYDPYNDQWTIYFDGSIVGLVPTNINAFALEADGSILMSFDEPIFLSDINAIVDDSDIVRYNNNAGSSSESYFEMYLAGADVGLTTDDEEIDAMGFTPQGELLVSTKGGFTVNGVSGGGEDLLKVFKTGQIANPYGVELYLDGSDIGLDAPTENVWGSWMDTGTAIGLESPDIYLTTQGAFTVGSLTGDGADIFICKALTVGGNSQCDWNSTAGGVPNLYWDGSAHGFGGQVIDGFAIVHEQVPGSQIVENRATYSLAGQVIAQRITSTPANPARDGLRYLHSDHLGSATAMSSTSGAIVPGTLTRFLPFGGYRTAPTADLTELGFTGHHENRDIGLTYMNARFYVPGIGRFASADTIVPNPANPQNYNRYTYVNNNPLRFNDPTGHCGADASTQDNDDCETLRAELQESYNVIINGIWTLFEMQAVQLALQDMMPYLPSYVLEAFAGMQINRERIDLNTPDGPVGGLVPIGTNVMVLFNGAFVDQNGVLNQDLARWVILHESAHVFENTYGGLEAWHNSLTGATGACPIDEECLTYSTGQGQFSPYGSSSSWEDSAESWAAYFFGGDWSAVPAVDPHTNRASANRLLAVSYAIYTEESIWWWQETYRVLNLAGQINYPPLPSDPFQ